MQLPIINSEEALVLAHKADDYFYYAAYKPQFWLSELNLQANAAYAEHPDPADRHMQSGQAWLSFNPIFAHFKPEAFHHIIGILVRFCPLAIPMPGASRLHGGIRAFA